MTEKKVAAPADKAELYMRLLDSVGEIDSKSNFGSAYTAINGNMYTMISKHGVVGIRLPEPERSEFLQRYSSELFRGDPSWPPAKEFVAVPDRLLEKTEVLTPYLESSLRYVKEMKPKPSKAKS
jgi:TfoX/Sxy family transcriptional regulator of competence genes